MTTIRSDIRMLIAKYGFQAVQQELQAEMKEVYQFLRQQFEPTKNNLIIPVATVIPDRIATPHLNPIQATVSAMEPPMLELESEEQEVQEDVNRDPTLKEVVIQAKKEMTLEANTEKFTKAKHRELVEEKHKELVAKGIKPETLLTKENLTTWLSQGMSYMRIARELTGVPENEISAIAKTFGLQSDIKKYIAIKRGSK